MPESGAGALPGQPSGAVSVVGFLGGLKLQWCERGATGDPDDGRTGQQVPRAGGGAGHHHVTPLSPAVASAPRVRHGLAAAAAGPAKKWV
ncbi:hypothetical protein [Nonomuraea jabiensis]|uniref:hypothetical protein n=1 Tax=Nonomuraea jabiensis TaxID=882448 RepID=UPI0016205867|nr:hypothetical protein [Nonomuraea jabiensis]